MKTEIPSIATRDTVFFFVRMALVRMRHDKRNDEQQFVD